jgi:hypothetical protein
MEICYSCGDVAYFRVVDVCPDEREIFLDACCDANLDGWLEAIRSCSPAERREWVLRETGAAVRDIVVNCDSISWALDFGLRVEEISFADACDFIRNHHRHCEPPVGWKFGAAVFNGAELVGVMTAGRPVSPALARQGCIEVNRVCVKDHRPRELVRNACSMLYAHACREAFRRGHRRVITYTLETERGSSLRASGFVPVARSRGGSWNRAGRPRAGKSVAGPKIRWERLSDAKRVPKQMILPLAA